MRCTISPEIIDKVIQFHGHKCPGLAIGIRAAEIALKDVGHHSKDEEIVAVVETDMCGVDAIQFLTGCTFGKGNLLFQDYGKVAFSFFNRNTNKNVRMRINPEADISGDDKEKRYQEIMECSLDELFITSSLTNTIPKKARLHESFICHLCQEKTMETRGRFFANQKICIPCFNQEEQR